MSADDVDAQHALKKRRVDEISSVHIFYYNYYYQYKCYCHYYVQ
jgi:hypothetical protein